MKILILCLPGIGDALMTTPMIKILKESKPNTRIDVAVMFEPVYYLFKNNPYIDNVYYLPLYKSDKLSGIKHIYRLRGNNYDISFLAFPAYRREYHFVHWLIGAKKRVAHCFQKGYLSEFNFLNSTLMPFDENEHHVINNLNLLKTIGIHWVKKYRRDDIKYNLTLDKKDEEFGRRFLKKDESTHDLTVGVSSLDRASSAFGKLSTSRSGFYRDKYKKIIIGIHPGSINSPAGLYKRWPIERYAELTKYLIKYENAKILIFIGPYEIELGNKLLEMVNNPSCKLINNVDFSKSVGILSQIDLLISNDNGFAHLANALGIKSIVLFGPTNMIWCAPYDRKAASLIRKAKFNPWFRNDIKVTSPPNNARGGMDAISVKNVIERLNSFYLLSKKLISSHTGIEEFNQLSLQKEQLNILVLSWRDPKHPLGGGAEHVVHEHAKGWIAAGHKVTLFASLLRGIEKSEDFEAVHIIRKGYQYLGVQIAALFYFTKNSDKYDLIIDGFHGIPFFTPLFTKIPKLALIHETTREVWFLNPLPHPYNWIIGILGFISEPFIFRLYKKIDFLTVSNSTKSDIVSLGIPKKKIHIIHNGLDNPNIADYKKEKKLTIAFLGTLSRDKGIEDALKCFSLLNSTGDFQFWVIGRQGEQNYLYKLQNIIKKNKLSKRVRFWGYVPEKEKFNLLSKAHILINPSIREGWGLVNLEANSVGTPVVAYNSPGLRDSVKHGVSGLIVKQNTPQHLADAILGLMNNRAEYEKLQKGAIQWSKKFSWEKSKKMSLKLIEKVAKESL